MKSKLLTLIFTGLSGLFFTMIGIKGVVSASSSPQDTCRTLITRLGTWQWAASCTGGCGESGGTCQRLSEPGPGGTWYYCRCKWVDQEGDEHVVIPDTDCTAKVLIYPEDSTFYPHVDCYKKNCSANCRGVDPSKMTTGTSEDACTCPDN